MLDLFTVTSFLGWCAVLNIGLLLFAAFIVVVFNTQIRAVHVKYVSIEQKSLNTMYFSLLGRYKVAIITFNLVPYFALKIMA